MLIKDIIYKEKILCQYLDYKNYNFETFEIIYEPKSVVQEELKYYTYKSNHTEFGQEDFEYVEDEEYYMYITDKYLFICENKYKEWNK